MKCRYCKKFVLDTAKTFDRVVYSKTIPEIASPNNPVHETAVVVFRQNVLHNECGHVASARYIHIRVSYDGTSPKCWTVDLKENK